MTAQSDEALDALETVAWLHCKDGRVDVAHDKVKSLWEKVRSSMVSNYTVELVRRVDAERAIESLRQQVRERDEHLNRLTGMKFSDRTHAALVCRAEAAERRAKELEQALRSVLDTRNAEAKAMMAWQVAADNFTNAKREQNHAERLLLAASNAEKAARELLDAARKDSHGN